MEGKIVLKKVLKIKKIIIRIIIAILAVICGTPLFMFLILLVFFMLFYTGANSGIEWVENLTYAINDKVTDSNYYDQDVIKDRIVLNGGKFVITEVDDRFNLIMYTKYNKVQNIILNSFYWDVLDNKIYVVGDNEYAVTYTDMDEEDKCKVLLKNSSVLIDEITNYSEDIKILNSFEEFTKDEQRVLLDIKNNGSLFVDTN